MHKRLLIVPDLQKVTREKEWSESKFWKKKKKKLHIKIDTSSLWALGPESMREAQLVPLPQLCPCRISVCREVTWWLNKGKMVAGFRNTGPCSEVWQVGNSPGNGTGLLIWYRRSRWGCRWQKRKPEQGKALGPQLPLLHRDSAIDWMCHPPQNHMLKPNP